MDKPQHQSGYHLGVASGQMAKRVMDIWMVKRKPRFNMRSC